MWQGEFWGICCVNIDARIKASYVKYHSLGGYPDYPVDGQGFSYALCC